MKLNRLQTGLERAFYRYGRLVGRRPLPFLVLPIIVTVLLAAGALRFRLEEDTEALYSPTNGRAKQERAIIQAHFGKDDDDGFISARKTTLEGLVVLVITARDDNEGQKEEKEKKNIFNPESLNAIRELEKGIHSLEISYHQSDDSGVKASSSLSKLKYEDICEKWQGSCEGNGLLEISAGSGSGELGGRISYPYYRNVFLPTILGGVELVVNSSGRADGQAYVATAEAATLAYHIKHKTPADVEKADLWLDKVREFLLGYGDRDNTRRIQVDFLTSNSLAEELTRAAAEIVPYFAAAYTILFCFSVASSRMKDWVRSKPLVVMAGQLAAILAVASSMGLVVGCGLPFVTSVASMPFLIIGIGIDDMFVMLSAWRHTNFLLPVEERMGQTMRTAAVSITVTSVTDMLAFGVGSITTFRAVTYFCAYTGVAVLFSYIYAITFLAACMIYSGRREASNRHAYTLKKILPTTMASGSGMHLFFCTGGYISDTDDRVTVNASTQDKDSRPDQDLQEISTNLKESTNSKSAVTADSASANGSNQSKDTRPTQDLQVTNTIARESTDSKSTLSANNRTDPNEELHAREAREMKQKPSTQSAASNSSGNTYQKAKAMFALPGFTEFLRVSLGPFVVRRPVKLLILGLYLIYLGFAIWGCLNLQEGLQLKNLAPDDSYLLDFYRNYDDYFLSKYGPSVMVAITESLDYSDRSTRKKVLNEIQKFTTSSEFYPDDGHHSGSWLGAFDAYLLQLSSNNNHTTENIPQNMTDFIGILRSQFLAMAAYEQFRADINFNGDYSQIPSCRFLLRTKGYLEASPQERALQQRARRLAANAAYSMTVFHPDFVFTDMHIVILGNTLQNLGIAVVSMLLVSFFLLPNLVSIVAVALSVVSICAGVVGYMVHWGVALDSISMMNLIMCVGFSVDFSAHICYHFSCVSRHLGNNDERAVEAIARLGMPITQGAVSTVLGVAVLAYSSCYIFRTFFKIFFMVMVFGFFHALFVLPVVLSIVSPSSSPQQLVAGKSFARRGDIAGKISKISADTGTYRKTG